MPDIEFVVNTRMLNILKECFLYGLIILKAKNVSYVVSMTVNVICTKGTCFIKSDVGNIEIA